jgi:predicted nucleic acid-binding protein
VIVVDASVIVHLILPGVTNSYIRDRVFDSRRTLHAPELLDLEIIQVLGRYQRRNELTKPRLQQAFEDFRGLSISRHSHAVLVDRIWQLRNALTAYDAAYLALAEALDATLLTCDAGLAKIARLSVKTEFL